MRSRVGDRYPVLFDRAVRSDQSGRANRAFNGFALRVFARSPSTIGFHGVFLRIGQQYERQVELSDKAVVGVESVGADTYNDSISFCHRIDSVAEPARFLGSARGIVFGIKP